MSILFEPYVVIKFFHIVMAGIWLGMDVGVYTAAKKLRDPNLSIETRASMGKLAGFLDMGPRSALIILLMLGITLTFLGGWGFKDTYGSNLAILATIFGVVWLAGVWHQYWVDHPNLGEKRPQKHLYFQKMFKNIDLLMRIIITGILAITATLSLSGGGPIEAHWLSIKLILFSIIVACGIGIRIYIPQARKAISDIFEHGSTPEREARLSINRGKSLFFVKSIWLLVACIIWISVAKI